MKQPFPRIPFLRGWDAARQLLQHEFQQSLEEGRDPEGVSRLQAQAAALGDEAHAGLADVWYALQEVPQRADFPFVEPNDLEAIREERPEAARRVQPGQTPPGDVAMNGSSTRQAFAVALILGARAGAAAGAEPAAPPVAVRTLRLGIGLAPESPQGKAVLDFAAIGPL